MKAQRIDEVPSSTIDITLPTLRKASTHFLSIGKALLPPTTLWNNVDFDTL